MNFGFCSHEKKNFFPQLDSANSKITELDKAGFTMYLPARDSESVRRPARQTVGGRVYIVSGEFFGALMRECGPAKGAF